jgi:sugar phosphate isomerase/epimerase
MFEEIESPNFGLNYDPSHMIWQGMDYIKPLIEFREKLFHIHIKDAKVLKEKLDNVGTMATPLEYHVPKLPGLGDVDWGLFFCYLTESGYDGPVCIEVEDRAYEGSLEKRIAALRQSIKYISRFTG